MSQEKTGKTMKIFALASFLNDFGSDMIYPIWPLFLTTILNANMAVLGFTDGLGDAIVSISQAISGYVADKTRRRKGFIWTGYLFGSFSRLGYAFSTVWEHVIPFRILDRAGKMRGAPRDASIADLSTNANRGKNFGLLRAMDNLGAVCGIVVCTLFILFFGLPQYRYLFLLAALPSMIGATLIFFLIKETKPSGTRLYKGLSLKDLDRNFKLFLVVSAVFALGSFSYSFLLIFAMEFGFNVTFLPILYLIFTAVASITSLPFGRLADKVGRRPILVLSYLFWGLVSSAFILVQSHLAIIFAFVLFGLHKGAFDPVHKTLVAELAPERYRASSLGSFQMAVGLCALPSSFVAGILWDAYGFSAPFYFSLCLTIPSLAMLGFVREKRLQKYVPFL